MQHSTFGSRTPHGPAGTSNWIRGDPMDGRAKEGEIGKKGKKKLG